jgi:D-alanyl-D-alanine carboxypeptidase
MPPALSTLFSKALAPLFLAVVLAAQPAAARFQLDAAGREKIEAEAQRLIAEQHTPGVAVAIMSEGQIVYAKGFGFANLETGTPVSPDSVFVIGSNTKQFTAVAIMLLAEQGKLRLDDPLSKYFPDFPRGNEVTLRHLLTHTSGIHPVMVPGGLPTPEQRVGLRTAADLVPIIQGQINLYDFEPGTSGKYSNSGYILLGVIIEKVSGLSLADFFKHHLFDRAGMTATALDDDSEVVPNRASGYQRAPGKNVYSKPPLFSGVGTGGGGMRSTVGDMLRWQDALLSGRIISLESLMTMTNPGHEGGPFGVGISEIDGHTVYRTGGGGPGFRSNAKMFPDERIGFVVMTNSGALQARARLEPSAGPPEVKQPAVKSKGPGKKGPGKMGPGKKSLGSGRGLQDAPNPARELEQVITEVITAGLAGR